MKKESILKILILLLLVIGVLSCTASRKTVKPEMSRKAVKGVIDKNMNDIYKCYESELKHHPNAAGRVLMEWEILPTGKVGIVRVKEDLLLYESDRFSTCLKIKIKSWEFPEPEKKTIVSYPFVFQVLGSS